MRGSTAVPNMARSFVGPSRKTTYKETLACGSAIPFGLGSIVHGDRSHVRVSFGDAVLVSRSEYPPRTDQA
jgi:hypothetical protein